MINTINGPIKKENLGLTLSHEHFRWISDEEYTNKVYNKNYDNEVIEESYNVLLPTIQKLVSLGCTTIVEASPTVGGQDLMLLKKISRATGIQIIPTTGWDSDFNESQISPTKDFFASKWIEEFDCGLDTIENTVIKPGYIKILLCSDETILNNTEKAMLEAASSVSIEKGIPIHCHMFTLTKFNKAMEFIDANDLNFYKFVWAHAGIVDDYAAMDRALNRGFWLGFDSIKPERYDINLRHLKYILDKRLSNRVLLSQDYDLYEETKKDPNKNPCSSIFEEFIPLCEKNGIPKQHIYKILKENPANFYSIDT